MLANPRRPLIEARHLAGRAKRRATHEASRWWAARTAVPPEAPAPPQPFVRQEGDGPRVPWPALPPAGYLGQLEPAFQAKMAASRAFLQRPDCDFYHTTTLPDGEILAGAWDLRAFPCTAVGCSSAGRPAAT
jgi:hypothetical protein